MNLSTGTITYLVSDALGSVRGVVSSAGSLTASTAYDAWGNPETTGGLTAETPFGFAGGYTDPTGLIYLIGRYYDPATGQFLSVDPMVQETGQPYAYTDDDPVNAVDPMGLFWGEGTLDRIGHDTVSGLDKARHVGAAAADVAAAGVRNYDPFYAALNAYDAEYHAEQDGCSLSTVFGDASRAVGDVVAGSSILAVPGAEVAEPVADTVAVIGRQVDTAVAKDWAGHEVLDIPDWSPAANDDWVSSVVKRGMDVYTASPTTAANLGTLRLAGQRYLQEKSASFWTADTVGMVTTFELLAHD